MLTIQVMKILVIEDDSDVRESLKQTLEDEAFVVDAVDNGSEGLYRAEEWKYDVILLDVMLPELASGRVTCDPFRLEQVITNLVNNAIQHNEQPITITLRSRLENDCFCIEVSDTGKGIQSENLEKLFDRFYQESTSRTQRHGQSNVGLGLSISEAIVRAHRGTFGVKSVPYEETVFTMAIPYLKNYSRLIH